MIKEIENEKNLIELKNVLEKFFIVDDCKNLNCEECKHKRLCHTIYRLDTTLNIRYLRKKGGNENDR